MRSSLAHAPVEMWCSYSFSITMWCEKSIQHQPTSSPSCKWEPGIFWGANSLAISHTPAWFRWDFGCPHQWLGEMVCPPAMKIDLGKPTCLILKSTGQHIPIPQACRLNEVSDHSRLASMNIMHLLAGIGIGSSAQVLLSPWPAGFLSHKYC